MILAGKCQDKFGPRITSFLGGIFVGIGLILISTTTSYLIWLLGFGVLAGIGIGFGYSAATPPALKWFPLKRQALLPGLLYQDLGWHQFILLLCQIFSWHIWHSEINVILRIAFLVIVCILSLMLINPPAGYIPEGSTPSNPGLAKVTQANFLPSEMLKTGHFTELAAILHRLRRWPYGNRSVAGMAKKSMGDMAFIAVAIMAIGNAGEG
jgi:MFS family permease